MRTPIMFMALAITATATMAVSNEMALPVDPTATIETICEYGYSKRVRPPYSVTNAIKVRKLREIGLTEADKSRFALDHIIAIELGGAPDDLRNFQLQGWQDSKAKDDVENCLHAMVCSERISLDRAQQLIWDDWREAAAYCR
jgi:hypothetical protein